MRAGPPVPVPVPPSPGPPPCGDALFLCLRGVGTPHRRHEVDECFGLVRREVEVVEPGVVVKSAVIAPETHLSIVAVFDYEVPRSQFMN